MANVFTAAGAAPTKQTKYSPLFTNRFFTGLWTQRSPLRDAATQYDQERVYGARYDSIIDGENVEITNRLTLARRPGLSVYNSQLFPPIIRFYEFTRTIAGVPDIAVMADTADDVYNATGPNTKVSILTKGVGAGQTYFQGVRNYLFMGDGVEEKKWDGTTTTKWGVDYSPVPPVSWRDPLGVLGDPYYDGYPMWLAVTDYSQPYLIIETTNFSLQLVVQDGTSDVAEPTWNTLLGGTTTDGTVSWKNVGNAFSVSTQAPETSVNYVFSYLASADESVSSTSPNLTDIFGVYHAVRHLDGSPFQIAGVGSADPQVDFIRIYRTASGGSTLFFLADIPNPGLANWQYIDTTPDAELNQFIQAPVNHQNDPPPAGLVKLAFHLGRILGAVGNRVYYSQGPSVSDGNGNTAFDPTKYFEYPSQVQRIWPMALGALVFTLSDIFIILGQGTDNSPLFSIPYLPRIGLLSYNAFDVNGSVAYLVATDKTAVSLDPSSGYSEVGFPIGDLIEDTLEESNAYVAWHNGGSKDKALYLIKAAGTDTDTGFRGAIVPTRVFSGSTVIAGILPSNPDPPESLELYLNGVLQTEGVDYTLVSSIITWTTPIGLTDVVIAWYRVLATGSFGDAIVPTGTINGVNTVFTLPSSPAPNDSLRLYLNGVVQTRGIDYALLGSTITYLVTPPQTGDSLIAWYRLSSPLVFADQIVPTGLKNGVNATFTLPSTPTPPESLMLFKNGIVQKGGGTDYTLFGSTVLFTDAPQSADSLIAWYLTGQEIGAGSGWFRMNQTAAPEFGLNWSPFASINQNPDPLLAGCSAVQSLQTSPGVHNLLVGPFAEGPILKRDLSVHADNGTQYSASATIGSLVLAKPGQIAGIGFITTDCPKSGASPIPGLWFDEDSTAAGAPAAALLTQYVNDPPQLSASATIDGRRYYVSQTQEPAWCRHMQIRFDWGTATTPDELYTYTIFGAVFEEL